MFGFQHIQGKSDEQFARGLHPEAVVAAAAFRAHRQHDGGHIGNIFIHEQRIARDVGKGIPSVAFQAGNLRGLRRQVGTVGFVVGLPIGFAHAGHQSAGVEQKHLLADAGTVAGS